MTWLWWHARMSCQDDMPGWHGVTCCPATRGHIVIGWDVVLWCTFLKWTAFCRRANECSAEMGRMEAVLNGAIMGGSITPWVTPCSRWLLSSPTMLHSPSLHASVSCPKCVCLHLCFRIILIACSFLLSSQLPVSLSSQFISLSLSSHFTSSLRLKHAKFPGIFSIVPLPRSLIMGSQPPPFTVLGKLPKWLLIFAQSFCQFHFDDGTALSNFPSVTTLMLAFHMPPNCKLKMTS